MIVALVMRRSNGARSGAFGLGVTPVRAAMTLSSTAKYSPWLTLGLLGARGTVLCAITRSSFGMTVINCPIAPIPVNAPSYGPLFQGPSNTHQR